MRKITQISLLIFTIIFLYRMIFCNFLIDLSFIHKNVFSSPIKMYFPDGILSPIAKNKVQKVILKYIDENKADISKNILSYELDIKKFKIISIVNSSKNNNEKFVLTTIGSPNEQVIFHLINNKVTEFKTEQ